MPQAELRPPQYATLPATPVTFGPEVADLCASIGFAPDAEQRLLLDQVFAMSGDRPASIEGCVVAPRQNLKTGFLKMCAIGWLFVTGEPLVTWTAHEFKTAREAFRDMKSLILGADYLDAEVAAVYEGAGNQSIELKTGQRLIFAARSKGSGRGFTGDKIILDEAYALTDEQIAALLPTLLTRGQAQVVYASSAGMVDSYVLRELRDRGRRGDGRGLWYAEWCDTRPNERCAIEDCDHSEGTKGCALDDVALWAEVMPSFGRRVDVDVVRMLRRKFTPRKFARECLGWWDEPPEAVSDLTTEGWQAAVTDDAPTGRMVLAVDAAPSSTWSSIVVCGGGVLELVDRRRGTGWLAERLADLCNRHGIAEVVLDPAGPIGGAIPDLEAAGLRLRMLTGSESASACGALVDAIAEKRIRVRHADAFLSAVAGAARRKSGDRWKWSRVSSEVDISPLVAATWAAWLYLADPVGEIMPEVYFV